MALEGDTKVVRDIGYVSWSDPLAPLENPKSSIFQAQLKEEQLQFQKVANGVNSTPWEELYSSLTRAACPSSPDYAQTRLPWIYDTIIAVQSNPSSPTLTLWILYGSKVLYKKEGITSYTVSETGYLATICDIGKGSELFEVTVYKLKESQKLSSLWKRSPVGPQLAFQGDRLLYLGVDKARLRSITLHSALVETGKDSKDLYAEKDEKVQLELLHPLHQSSVFLRGYNSLHQSLCLVKEDSVHLIKEKHGLLVPISNTIVLENESVQIGSAKVPLPPNQYGVAGVQFEGILYITTISRGRMSLWKLEENHFHRIGPVPSHPCEVHFLKGSHLTILVRSPLEGDQVVRIDDTRLTPVVKFPTPLPLRLVHQGSKLPFTVVRAASSRPLRGLLVEAYGAYGICMRRSYPIRWLPWLAAGWAVAAVAPRGGRDHGDGWWNAARGALKKHLTFEDTAIGIRAAQRCTGVKPANTILYGRSAGGWCAAQTGQQHPELLGAIYAEVPYLDILRTTTNPALPLTTQEYEEFGDPIHHPEHFTALAKITPMYTIPSAVEGTNVPFVLTRTGLYDNQVAAYEIFKWAIRLRSAGWTALVGVDSDGGHFAAVSDAIHYFATDAAILDSLIGYTPPRRSSTARHPRATSSR